MGIQILNDYTRPREPDKVRKSRPKCGYCGQRMYPHGEGNQYICLNGHCGHGREGHVIKKD